MRAASGIRASWWSSLRAAVAATAVGMRAATSSGKVKVEAEAEGRGYTEFLGWVIKATCSEVVGEMPALIEAVFVVEAEGKRYRGVLGRVVRAYCSKVVGKMPALIVIKFVPVPVAVPVPVLFVSMRPFPEWDTLSASSRSSAGKASSPISLASNSKILTTSSRGIFPIIPVVGFFVFHKI